MKKQNETFLFPPWGINDDLRQTARMGACRMKKVLPVRFLSRLVREIEQKKFSDAAGRIGDVVQNFQRFGFIGPARELPLLEKLRCATMALIRAEADNFPILAGWDARETVAQRYGRDGGLGSHKDLSRHPGVIAVYTIQGGAAFEVLESREGPVAYAYQTAPGDLILLRAPGLSGAAEDDRPFHRARGSITRRPRISVTFRDNLAPEKPIRGFDRYKL